MNTPPYFTNALNSIPIIPCLDSDEALAWSYPLPLVVDQESDDFFFEFNTNAISRSVIFNSEKSKLILDTSKAQPENGFYNI